MHTNHADLPLGAGLGVQPPPDLVADWIAGGTPEVTVSRFVLDEIHETHFCSEIRKLRDVCSITPEGDACYRWNQVHWYRRDILCAA